jgi:hypothetical protein
VVGGCGAVQALLYDSEPTAWRTSSNFAGLLGGMWGIYLALVENRFPTGSSYWVTPFLFGAILPTLIALLVVLPLKG